MRQSAGGLILLFFPLASLPGQEAVIRDVDIDHVILATPDLSRGIEEFARLTGVTPLRGGQHPGRGTENALVSLGAGHYLELLAPIGGRTDSSALHLTPMGWALHTRALPSLIALVRAAGFELAGPMPGSRRTPDSTLLQWRTASAAGPGLELAPFFIEWAAGTPHPSTTSPGGCRLVGLELVAPDTARLQEFLRAAGFHADVRSGNPRGFRLRLECPRGRVTFTS